MRVTVEEVRKLPEGSRVLVHSCDRYGQPQYLDCRVIKKGRFNALKFNDWRGFPHEVGIKKLKDDYYNYYEVIEEV